MIIVFFSDISWRGLHQRPQHLAIALSQHWKVLWVEPTTLLKKSHFQPLSVAPNIYVVSIPVIPYNARLRLVRLFARPLSHLPPVRKLISFLQVRLVRRALQLLESQDSPGCIINNFHCIDAAKRLSPTFICFDYIDNAFGFIPLPGHVETYWKKTIQAANFITVTSPVLAEQIAAFRNENIYVVGNGVEFEHFAAGQKTERPVDLPSGKPIVCYAGAVYPWLDYDLMQYACERLPGVNFVFLGPVHPQVNVLVRKLEKNRNIVFLGFQQYDKLPEYFQYVDVGIIPFQRNDLTRSVNPVKLYEYCAAGKPTVTTDFSTDLHPYRDHIFISSSKEDFVANIRKAIERSRDEGFVRQLQSFAREHDWNTKTSEIVRLINQYHSPH